MGRVSQKIALFLVVSLCLSSCAASKPKGKVVRIDSTFGTSDAVEPSAPKDAILFAQKDNNGLAIPSSKEDAAVFYFSMGQAFSLDSDPQKAIEAYRATLTYDPNSALVHARLAAELVKIGNYAEAKTLCENAIKLDSKYVDSYLLLAGIQVAAKEYDGALATYSKALAVDPKNRDALLYNGITLAEVGKTKEGITELEKLVRLKDNSESNIDQSVGYYYLAKIYEQANQRDAAIKALQESLKRRPSFSKAALSLADIYKSRRQDAKANDVLEDAFKESHSADIAERLADLHLQKNDYKGAIVYLETLVEEDPANENMRLRLALIYWQLQWLNKAHFVLSDLFNRYPNSSEIAFYLGELELERKDPDAALGYYKKINPEYSKYDQMVGRVVMVYRDQKRFLDAEKFLDNALEQRPDIVAFYPLLAALYEDQGKMAKARAVLERGYNQFDTDENILYYLGFLYDRQGDKEKGISMMEKLLVVNPKNSNALNFVGYTKLENGDLAKAAHYLEQAFALKPEDAFVLDSYGWLLYRQGKTKEAMKRLEKAHGLRPDEGVIAEHLADIYIALNLPQKALSAYLVALSSGGDKDFKSRVERKVANIRSMLAETDGERSPVPKKQQAQSVRTPASR